jgi:hypothetical protein
VIRNQHGAYVNSQGLPVKFKIATVAAWRFWGTGDSSPPLFLERALAFETKAFQIV